MSEDPAPYRARPDEDAQPDEVIIDAGTFGDEGDASDYSEPPELAPSVVLKKIGARDAMPDASELFGRRLELVSVDFARFAAGACPDDSPVTMSHVETAYKQLRPQPAEVTRRQKLHLLGAGFVLGAAGSSTVTAAAQAVADGPVPNSAFWLLFAALLLLAVGIGWGLKAIGW